ncbi:MAG: flagellar assembly protein FliW [Proteobacteria bacterium]|nr:flagellar assembly protein FliW [Pseudomonadota bacterium]MBU1709404.1 flagellar assembly protein FliW [Pseudomonadota bacterium]
MSSQENPTGIKISTSRFGELTIDKDKIIIMTSPFLGFPDSTRFILQKHGLSSPFMWFQSVDDPNLAFVVIQSVVVDPSYNPPVNDHIREELEATDVSELELLLILTIPRENPRAMTANLLGPVMINANKRLAKQVLLDPGRYDCCWPIISE